MTIFKLALSSLVLVAYSAAPLWAQKAPSSIEWEYAYEGNTLPEAARPAWELVEPQVKAGMTTSRHVENGVLALRLTGEKVSQYYQSGLLSSNVVWRADSEHGNTVEFRARITESVPGIPNTFLLSLAGLGTEAKQSAIFYFGQKGLSAGGKSIPLDLSQFHTFRITHDQTTKNIALYIDDAPTPNIEIAVSGIKPDAYAAHKILFGGTYAPAFQGAWELDYLRWTNKGAFAPGVKLAVPAGANVVPIPTPKAPVVRTPLDLNNPDIARANDLLARFERFPQIAIPNVSTAPVIDGKVDSAEWQDASSFMGLLSFVTRHVVQKPTRFFVAHDAEKFYLAWQLDRPDGSIPLTKVSTRVDNLWNKEDGLEILFSPDRERRTVFSVYANAASGYAEGFVVDGKGFDTSRNGGWTIRSRRTARGIEGELAIPRTAFNDVLEKAKAELDDESWGLNTMRVDLSPQMEQSDWSDMWSSGNYNGNFLGRLNLRHDAVAFQLQTLGALDENHIGARGRLVNRTTTALQANLSYAIYRATGDVRANKVYLYQTWDKVNRIRTTGSDFDEGAAVQLLMGENNWLQTLGRSYKIEREETRPITVAANGETPLEIVLDQPGGQFIIAAKLVDSTGRVLWAQTSPVEVKARVEQQVEKRFLTAGGVVVKLDVSGSEKPEGGLLRSTLTDTHGKTLVSWQSIVKSRFTPVEKFVPLSKQPAGNYVVTTKLFSPADVELGHNRTRFSKPVAPSWWKNRIGYSQQVPSPFTPVKATVKAASVWGRTYQWGGDSPFPQQIRTKNNLLLAAPVALELKSGGRILSWKTVSWQLATATPRTATYRSVHTAGPYKLSLATTVDFDGLIHFRGELNGKAVPIDSLKMRFPVKKDLATHFHAAHFETDVQKADGRYKAGSLADFATEFPRRATPFAGLFWLGSEGGGLQWIAQWDKGWNNPDRSRVMRLIEGKNSTTLEVSFIGQKTVLKEALPIDFAVNVSPVKDPSYFWKMGTVNGASTALYPKNWDPEKARADLKTARENGITHIMTGGYGWPFHADIWVRDHNRPNFDKIVKSVHEAGLQVFYYGSWGYDVNGKEAADFAYDMIKEPRYAGGSDTYWYNPEGPWVDFFMAGLDHTIKTYGIDGIYLDSMPVTGLCADPLLGQTYTDEKGHLHGRWAFWALRDWAMRLQNVFKITHRKNGIVYQHDSSVPNLAIVSLADVRCGGEDAPSRDSLRASWPLDAYFARNSIHAFGVPLETLWYNWWERPLKENNVLSVILLNGQMKNRTGGDYVPYRLKADYELDSTPNIAILKLFQGFDIPKAQWWPYYGKKNWIGLKPSTLLASSYVHPGKKALVVISNLDRQTIQGKVTLDLGAVGFQPGAVKVTDAFLKNEIPLDGNTIELEVKNERYRLLLVEAR